MLNQTLSVKQVYNKIADHFDVSRQRIWGSVKQFLDSLEPASKVLDLGCGNGKNMLYRKDLTISGIDNSTEQIRICKRKQLNAEVCDITELQYQDNTFDNMLCIATYHHLNNDADRQKALKEIHRCLRPDGTALITVWALEQHKGSTFHFKNSEEMVPWNTIEGTTYWRYYHIYKAGDLQTEITRLCPEIVYVKEGWELGNWYCILQKPI